MPLLAMRSGLSPAGPDDGTLIADPSRTSRPQSDHPLELCNPRSFTLLSLAGGTTGNYFQLGEILNRPRLKMGLRNRLTRLLVERRLCHLRPEYHSRPSGEIIRQAMLTNGGGGRAEQHHELHLENKS